MAEAPDYGIRLTDEEYERRIVDLHRGLPPVPTPEQDREIRRRALDLAIDHRLGRNFPQERREALWKASERVNSKRIWIGLSYLIRSLAGGRAHAEALTKALGRQYSKVLTPPELEQFLGPAPLTLPIDREPRRRA